MLELNIKQIISVERTNSNKRDISRYTVAEARPNISATQYLGMSSVYTIYRRLSLNFQDHWYTFKEKLIDLLLGLLR